MAAMHKVAGLRNIGINFLSLLMACVLVWETARANNLSDLPTYWQGKLLAIPTADLSGAELVARQAMETAREKTADSLAAPSVDSKILAWEFGNLGNLYQLYNIPALAKQCYANAQTLEPDNFRWSYYAGYLALTDGRVQEALTWFDQVAQLKPGYPPLVLRQGQAWYEQGDLGKAREALRLAVERPGLRAMALYYLGQIDLLDRNYPQAIKQFEEALAIDPESSQIHYPLARAYRAAGDEVRAREHLALKGKQKPTVDDRLVAELNALEKGARPYYDRAMQAIKNSEYLAAVESFRNGLERDPQNVNARVSFARSLFLANEPQKAQQNLDQVLRATPDNVLALFLKAVLLESNGEVDQAVALYQKVLSFDPEHAGANFFLANRLMQLHRYAEAEPLYARAVIADPANSVAVHYFLIAQYRSGKPPKNIKLDLEKAIKRHPNRQVLKYTYVRLLALSKDELVHDPAIAVEAGTELVKATAFPPYLEALALAEAAAGNFDQALAIQNQLVMSAVWMGGGPYQERFQNNYQLLEKHELPAEVWPEDDPMLMPQLIDATSVFRAYPSPVPY